MIYPEQKPAQKALTVELVETNQPTDSQVEGLDNEATTEAVSAPLVAPAPDALTPAPAPVEKPKVVETKEEKLKKLKIKSLLAEHFV